MTSRAGVSSLLICLVLALSGGGNALAQDDTASTQPASTQPAAAERGQVRRGTFHIAFTEPDPRSSAEAQHARRHIPLAEMQRYTLADESFEATVPLDYDAGTPHGIIVFVSAGDRGSIPRGWADLLQQHHLIYLGANGSGNERDVSVRFALALDGVFNLRKLYNIDDARIYVSGISGGGKVASQLAVLYPETFTGAIPIVGVSYFTPITLPDDPLRAWPPGYERPPLATFDVARQQTRFVLITGTNDMNHDPIVGTYERGFVKDEFKYVELFDVPGMGHSLPPIEYVDRAIRSLDAPLPAVAKRQFERAQQLETAHKNADAMKLYTAAANHGDADIAGRAKLRIAEISAKIEQPATTAPSRQPIARGPRGSATQPVIDEESAAQSLLGLAQSYERSGLYPQAKQRAEQILQDHPHTRAAEDAKRMVQRMK